MSTKFYCYNEVLEANIFPSTENAQFPASNLKQIHRSKVFRSLTNEDFIVFDFGYPAKIDVVMAVCDPMSGNKLSTCKVLLDNDHGFGSALEIDLEIDQKHQFIFAEVDSPTLYRYMKIEMTSTAGYCELSKLFAGAKMDLPEEVDFTLPFNFSLVNNAKVSTNELGQRFTDEKSTFKKISGSMKTLTKSELDGILDIIDYSGGTKPIWVLFDSILNNSNRLSGYYYPESTSHTPSLDTSLHWSIPFNLTEAL